MRDFSGIETKEIKAKITSMASGELGEALNELMRRQIISYREDLEDVGDIDGLRLLQGRIAQLKDLRTLFQTKAVPRKGQQGEL